MIGLTSENYQNALAKLFPTGKAWDGKDVAGFNLYDMLLGIADEMARVDGRALELLNEAYPDTTVELLSDWEVTFGLPETCAVAPTALQDRRAALLFKILLVGRQDKQFYIDLAAVFGYEITITEFQQSGCGISSCGDPMYDDDWVVYWQVNAELYNYRAAVAGGSQASDPLRSFGNAGLECLLNKYKPAHTEIIFSYT